MSEKDRFKDLLKRAAKSARQKAGRNMLPYAISENGNVKLIYPDKSEKIVHKHRSHKKAPVRILG